MEIHGGQLTSHDTTASAVSSSLSPTSAAAKSVTIAGFSLFITLIIYRAPCFVYSSLLLHSADYVKFRVSSTMLLRNYSILFLR